MVFWFLVLCFLVLVWLCARCGLSVLFFGSFLVFDVIDFAG